MKVKETDMKVKDDVELTAKRHFGCLSGCLLLVLAVILGLGTLVTQCLENRDGKGALTGQDVTVEVPSPLAKDGAARALKDKERERAQEEALKAAENKFRAEVRACTVGYQSKLDALHARFAAQIPYYEAARELAEARTGTDFIVSGDGLCGFKALSVLAWKLAYDKVKGTDRFGEAVRPLIEERVNDHLANAVAAYGEKVREFQRELDAETEAYKASVRSRSAAFSQEVLTLRLLGEKTLRDVNARIAACEGQVAKMAASTVSTTLGVTVETFLIRQTVAVSARLLAGISARLVGSAATAGAAVVADGPLPIGDVVGAVIMVGGLGWTAWDIYDLKKTMPEELRTILMQQIEEVDRDLRTRNADWMAEAVKARRQWSEQQMKEVCNGK